MIVFVFVFLIISTSNEIPPNVINQSTFYFHTQKSASERSERQIGHQDCCSLLQQAYNKKITKCRNETKRKTYIKKLNKHKIYAVFFHQKMSTNHFLQKQKNTKKKNTQKLLSQSW